MDIFQLFSSYSLPVMVIKNNGDVVFRNLSFEKTFAEFRNFESLARHFSFDVCLLDSENIQKQSPLHFALHSAESFFAQAVLQNRNNQFFSFNITSTAQNGFKIIILEDTTTKANYETLLKDFLNLKNEYLDIIKENQKFSEIQQKAQSQAIKMALLNRFTNTIRESVNLDKVMNSALKELCVLFGGYKAYFASGAEKQYKIEHIYPETFDEELNRLISFDGSIEREINGKNHHVSQCIREYRESRNTFKNKTARIVIPVYQQSNLLGVLVILSNQNISLTNEQDVLKSISTQLATTIVQASLFEQINEKNTQLEATLKELKDTQLQLINSEKMASLGQLVAGVAHEINTPLASINSNNSIINRLISKIPQNALPQEILDMLKEINEIDKEGIKRISKIVNSLKQFVRLDEAELQQTDINKELDLTLDLIRHETKNRIEIKRDYGRIPLIKCYPNMLNQVFMNILINACQSIEDKGEIRIRTEYRHRNLVIKIKDTGYGISEENKPKIFHAGYTSKRAGLGTGLGLAISKKIIQKHGGEITFSSEEDKGTEFVVTIPNK